MKEPKPVYGLYLSKNAEHEVKLETDYDGTARGTMEVSVVKLENGKVRNDSHGPFDDLVFRCTWSEKLDDGRPYAWEVEYRQVYAVDLANAERMLKVLRKLHRAKLPLQPATFGQYAVLMARVLGIGKLVQCTEKWGSMYTEMEHRVDDISMAQGVLDRTISEAYRKQKPEAVSA